MNIKNFISVVILGVLSIILNGCASSSFLNLTKKDLEKNTSGIYTISMSPRVTGDRIIPGTGRAYIVINGEKHCMEESCLGSNLYDFAYKTKNTNQNILKYYFIYEYSVENKGMVSCKSLESDIYCLNIINQFVITMVNDRGYVGSKVAILGEGFTQYDRVVIGGMEAETNVTSKNSIEFTVPVLEANKVYGVHVQSGACDLYVGEFLVDAAELIVYPRDICVRSGDTVIVSFSLDKEAPRSGLYINVETDIPESVIIPEVIIPAGSKMVSVPLEGGACGEGRLYVDAPGFQECVVDVRVE